MDFTGQVLWQPTAKNTLSLRLATVNQERGRSPSRSPPEASGRAYKPIAASPEPSRQISPVRKSRLLALPTEILGQIYYSMTAHTRSDHLNFLLSCRRVFNEGCESFFCRPLICSSQDRLIDFTAAKTSTRLAHVQTLEIQLRDLDIERIKPFLAQITLNMSARRCANPYDAERDRIIDALRKLPHVKHIVILKPRNGSPAAPRKMVDDVLACLGKTYHNLRSLQLEVDAFNMQRLNNFKALQLLRVGNFSRASPKHILESVHLMPELRTLQLVRPPTETKWRNRCFRCPNTMSFVPPTSIQQLPGQKPSLEVSEIIHASDPVLALLHPHMLRALCRNHAHILEDLMISGAAEPDPTTIALLVGLLLTATRLYRLALTWPGINAHLLECVPATVRYLSLAVSGLDEAGTFLSRLSTMSHKLPSLQQVELLMINRPTVVPTQAQDQKTDQPVSLALPVPIPTTIYKMALPWEVKWGTWEPVPAE